MNTYLRNILSEERGRELQCLFTSSHQLLGEAALRTELPTFPTHPAHGQNRQRKASEKDLLWELAAEIRLACPNVVNAKGMWGAGH